MKKISKLIIGLMMAFLFVLNVNAATPNPSSDKGTLTVTNVVSGDTFKAYKIVDTTYDSATNTIGYTFTTEFQAFLTATSRSLTVDQYLQLTGGDTTSGSPYQNNDLDALMSAYAAYVKDANNNVSGTAMTTSGTTATLANQAPGAYMIIPTQTNRVYAVMVGNLTYEPSGNNDWQFNNTASINAKVSDPSLTKVINESTGLTENSYDLGDTVPFKITMTKPTYPANATNKTLIITDTLDAGLTAPTAGNVTVKDGETTLTNTNGTLTDNDSHTVGTVAVSGQVITITLNDVYLHSTTITAEYNATVNSTAVKAGVGNKNTAKLTYSNDPYGVGTNDTVDSIDTVYTYGIKVYKTDNETPATPLQGAVFAIYEIGDSTCSGTPRETITTGVDGIATGTSSYAAGSYYAKEISAPAGYRADNTCRLVTINTSNAYTQLDVQNVPMGLLPSTGGIGTYIYIAAGALLVVAVITVAVVYTRKNKEEK